MDFILLHGNKIQLAEIGPIWNSKAELKAELTPNQGVLTQTYPKEAYCPQKNHLHCLSYYVIFNDLCLTLKVFVQASAQKGRDEKEF